jgi:hypothetical protein
VYQPQDKVYALTVSGVVTAPQVADVYSNNATIFSVAGGSSIVAGSGTLMLTGQFPPASSGNLKRVDGFSAGDNTIAFSAFSISKIHLDTLTANPSTGRVGLQHGYIAPAVLYTNLAGSGSININFGLEYSHVGTFVITNFTACNLRLSDPVTHDGQTIIVKALGASTLGLNCDTTSGGTFGDAVVPGFVSAASSFMQFAGRIVSFTAANGQWWVTGNVPITSDGSYLTNLNAANLTGTLQSAQIPATIPTLNGANSFTGTNTFGNTIISGNPGQYLSVNLPQTNANGITLTSGQFIGNGGGLTNIAGVALLGGTNTFTGSNFFTGQMLITTNSTNWARSILTNSTLAFQVSTNGGTNWSAAMTLDALGNISTSGTVTNKGITYFGSSQQANIDASGKLTAGTWGSGGGLTFAPNGGNSYVLSFNDFSPTVAGQPTLGGSFNWGAFKNTAITTGSITATNGYFLPTNSPASWPANAGVAGTAFYGNSNGWIYLLTSAVGSTAWTKTNLIATP